MQQQREKPQTPHNKHTNIRTLPLGILEYIRITFRPPCFIPSLVTARSQGVAQVASDGAGQRQFGYLVPRGEETDGAPGQVAQRRNVLGHGEERD